MNTLPCTGKSEVFFSLTPRNIAEATALCETCPEKAICLSNALNAEDGEPLSYRFGIYGALTPEERFALT
jgi:hypothetical protein